jgi:RHS repeat-associated protein
VQTASGTTTTFYLSSADQIIEERQGSTVTDQNIWNIDFVNDLLLRDDNSTSGSLGTSGSGLGKRLYSQHDANFNVTSITDASGNVLQRFVYTPYGQQTVLTTAWTTTTNAYDWSYYFQGMRLVPSGQGNLYLSQSRIYDSTVARWEAEDPDSYVDGTNLYSIDAGNPADRLDPLGTNSTHNLFFGWYSYLSGFLGLGPDVQGMWGDFSSEDSTGLTTGNQNLYYPVWKEIAIDPAFVNNGVVTFSGRNTTGDMAMAAALGHEIWHAYFARVVKKCPKMMDYFKNAAVWYGSGTKPGIARTITADNRLVVLDEAIGVTVENYLLGRSSAKLLNRPYTADPRSAGYLSGEGLSDKDKQDNIKLSKENWQVVKYLLQYGCKCNVDPQLIINTPEADWGKL